MSIDFTSARFLGFDRRTPSRPANLGKPALLAEPQGADQLARLVAASQGAAAGLVARSTLHALQDCLAVTAAQTPVLLDEHCYPITRWAARAVCEGATMYVYRHHDHRHVRRLLARLGRPAVVVADAWCAGCLRPTPLAELSAAAAAWQARLLVDDSLAYGVLGPGGAGTPRWLGIEHEQLLWVASTGKAYGIPIAVITGPAEEIARIRARGPHRVHSSPAATADIAELADALRDPLLNHRRHRALANARRFRQRVARLGLRTLGDPLPSIGLVVPAPLLHRIAAGLRTSGVRALQVQATCLGLSRLTFCVRADHTEGAVDAAVAALESVLARAA